MSKNSLLPANVEFAFRACEASGSLILHHPVEQRAKERLQFSGIPSVKNAKCEPPKRRHRNKGKEGEAQQR